MDATQVLVVIALVWVTIGITASVFMGRRGHSAFTWLVLGAVLGPLALPLGLKAIRSEHEDVRTKARPMRRGSEGPGEVTLLVGIDGSPQAEAALASALELFAERIARTTLAAVIDYESAASGRPRDSQATASSALDRAASIVTTIEPSTIILVGRPATALGKHAIEEDYGVLVIGRRGKGASTTLLGSTASKLAEGMGTPVLLAG